MIITICNQKGGSGKTTLAALIARTLPGDVLCLDCDPQGGLSSLLGVQGPGMFDLLIGHEVEPYTHPEGLFNMKVFPGDHRLDKIAYTLEPFAVEKLLKNCSADYVVIDTPPTVQGVTRAAILAADLVIIPADIARTTINPTLYTLEALGELKKSGRVVLIGKVPKDENHGYSAELYREFHQAIKPHYAGTVPRTAGAQKAAAGLQRVPRAIQSIILGVICNGKVLQ